MDNYPQNKVCMQFLLFMKIFTYYVIINEEKH